MTTFSRICICICFITLGPFSLSLSKVDPPNTSFTLNRLAPFFPGQKFGALQELFGKGKVLNQEGGLQIVRFEISHLRYKFPVMVQIANDRVMDFFAPLPSYFLHDLFHQSLINRYGPQDSYRRGDGFALYEWKNRQGLSHSYSGACTVTCFPLYYAVYPASKPTNFPKYKSIVEKKQDGWTTLKSSKI
ncbi:MAG: hypothetical protein OXB88_02580 [Bacteriovoracales bacterium]|nr:hypothetical protein [Bacteriovoracales bacterium]